MIIFSPFLNAPFEQAKHVMRIIISRTDNIGDVLLTLPLAGILKQYYPDCHVLFLARNYVSAVVRDCPHVDEFVAWDDMTSLSTKDIAKRLHDYHADIILHVFPNKRIAQAAKKAAIPQRIGTSHRWYHLMTCNHRVSFSRKRSKQHEALLNTQLLKPLKLEAEFTTTDQLIPYLKLAPSAPLPTTIQQQINEHTRCIVIHPGSNGHTREWPVSHFTALIKQLAAKDIGVFLTGSAGEAIRFAALIDAVDGYAINLMGRLSLSELVRLLHDSDAVVANSTGPLHIAAALGTNTLGLFPPAGSMSPQRWAPLGEKANFLVTTQPCPGCTSSNDCLCMPAITVAQVEQHILTSLVTKGAHAIET